MRADRAAKPVEYLLDCMTQINAEFLNVISDAFHGALRSEGGGARSAKLVYASDNCINWFCVTGSSTASANLMYWKAKWWKVWTLSIGLPPD
jgi:hypothetical protein